MKREKERELEIINARAKIKAIALDEDDGQDDDEEEDEEEEEEIDVKEEQNAEQAAAGDEAAAAVRLVKRRKRHRHRKWPKRKRPLRELQRGEITGQRGVLVTCVVGNEHRCAVEVVPFLDSVAATLLGETTGGPEVTPADAIEREAAEALAGAPSLAHVQAMECSMNGVIFVRVSHEQLVPTALCRAAVELAGRPECPVRFRYCVRLVPLDKTCDATVEGMVEAISPMLLKAFITDVAPPPPEPEPAAAAAAASGGEGGSSNTQQVQHHRRVLRRGVTYHVEYNKRKCKRVKRRDCIKALLAAIPDARQCAKAGVGAPDWALYNSDIAIIVELFKNTCGVSVIPEYDRFLEYNLHDIQAAALKAAAAAAKTNTTAR